MLLRFSFFAILAALIAVSCVSLAEAHAILKASAPAAGETVAGPDFTIHLTFNSRIDAARSRLLLGGKAGVQSLEIGRQSTPDTISADAKGVKPGEYRIQWQVLALDGHITRGELPFTVR